MSLKLIKKYQYVFLICLLQIGFILQVRGQTNIENNSIVVDDASSISYLKELNPERGKKNVVKSLILPLALIGTGTALHFDKNRKLKWQNSIRQWNPDFHTHADDYIPFIPVAALYWGSIRQKLWIKNDTWTITKNMILAQGVTAAIMFGLKYSVRETRPNGEAYSFPSGHASQSFVAAMVLYHETIDQQPWLAYSGLAIASSVAYLRVMNNVHWTSDVLAGAGLGLLITQLVYQYEPLKNWNPFQKYKEVSFLPLINGGHMGFALNVQLK